uniref:DUF3699 domain-containing protein n=1 Tax=Macrostomum lignano TaxID=282301 RepID=A0A1I8I986_9PLAT
APRKHARTQQFAIVHNQNGERVSLPLGGAAALQFAPLSASIRHVSVPFEANYPDRLHPLGGGQRPGARLKPLGGLETNSASAILAVDSTRPVEVITERAPTAAARTPAKAKKTKSATRTPSQLAAPENELPEIRRANESQYEAFEFVPEDTSIEAERPATPEAATDDTTRLPPPPSPPKDKKLVEQRVEASDICGPCKRRQ